MRLQKKPVETTATNNYAETTSTEVKLCLKRAFFFVNYVKKTVRCGNFFLSATVSLLRLVRLHSTHSSIVKGYIEKSKHWDLFETY